MVHSQRIRQICFFSMFAALSLLFCSADRLSAQEQRQYISRKAEISPLARHAFRINVDWAERLPGREFEAYARGAFRFRADDRAIISLIPDSELQIKVLQNSLQRTLHIVPDTARKPVIRYLENGVSKNPPDHNWIEEMLAEFIRETNLYESARASRLLKRYGSDSLISEIRQIRNSHVRLQYMDVLFASGPQLQSTCLTLVRSVAGREPFSARLAANLLYLREKSPKSELVLKEILRASSRIRSAPDAAHVLTTLARHLPASEDLQMTYLSSSGAIDDDRERLRALAALPSHHILTARPMENYLQQAGKFKAETQLTQALQAIAPQIAVDSSMQSAYLRLASRLSSPALREQAEIAVK